MHLFEVSILHLSASPRQVVKVLLVASWAQCQNFLLHSKARAQTHGSAMVVS